MFPNRRQPSSGKSGKPMRSSSKGGKTQSIAQTPLDRKQASLQEKEKQLQLQSEKLKQLIENAPRIREEKARKRRAELAGDGRVSSRTVLADRRYDVSMAANPSFGKRSLRSERRDGKLVFVVLLSILAVLIFWIYQLAVSHFGH